MAKTPYQTNPGAIRNPRFSANPLQAKTIVGAGSASHPKAFRLNKLHGSTVPINIVKAPGASGTI